MKKTLLTFVAFFTLGLTSQVEAQVVEQGKVIVDGYYGFPNLYSSIFKTAYANSGNELNLKIGSMGPVGIRGEYLISNKIGFGLDLGMNSTILTYSEPTQVYNSTTDTYTTMNYDYTFKTQKIGAIVTFNYHFIENDNFDAYFVFGAGYGNRTYDFKSTDPTYTSSSVKGLIPVAAKIGFGMRYFFTENIGANLAVGAGQGGLVNIGLSAKF
jgi:hypothetical protein